MIRLKMYAPLQIILGVSESANVKILDIPSEHMHTLQDVFVYMAERYPKFEAYVNPKPGDHLRSIVIVVDGKAIFSTAYKDVLLTENSEISMLPPYEAG